MQVKDARAHTQGGVNSVGEGQGMPLDGLDIGRYHLLRLIGSPGIGKTMISTFLVKELQEKAQRAIGKAFAYFFFDDKDNRRNEPKAMLRSLIWQLLLQKNELFDCI